MKSLILLTILAMNSDLTKLATNARSAADHRDVASRYESRAAELEAKAQAHEAEADKLARRTGYNPMAHKWPAMVQAPIDRERARAMDARKAAREARELAVKHGSLAGRVDAE